MSDGQKVLNLGNVVENPLKENCEEAGKFARENGCDFVVAFVGGAFIASVELASVDADMYTT